MPVGHPRAGCGYLQRKREREESGTSEEGGEKERERGLRLPRMKKGQREAGPAGKERGCGSPSSGDRGRARCLRAAGDAEHRVGVAPSLSLFPSLPSFPPRSFILSVNPRPGLHSEQLKLLFI